VRNDLHYANWRLEPIVEKLSQLDGMLEKAFQTHDQFIAAQIKYFKDIRQKYHCHQNGNE